MIEVNAYFYKDKVYMEDGREYKLGEILLQYLLALELEEDEIDLLQWYHECKRYCEFLRYPETKSESFVFGKEFKRAIIFYNIIDDLIYSLPPYFSRHREQNPLYELLNSHKWMFVREYRDDGIEREYYEQFRVNSYIENFDCASMINDGLKLNEELEQLAIEYFTFMEDVLRVIKVYIPLLEQIHSKNRFLFNEEIADLMLNFDKKKTLETKEYEKLQPSGTMELSYKPLKIKEHTVLAEHYCFTTIGTFLYIELFKGLQNHYLPRRCDYCGKFFLLERTTYANCCTRTVEGTNGRTCRDFGVAKKYADKVKDDPILFLYLRAYKRHYARYMKKRITKEEFQQWAAYALQVRQKAQDNEMSFEEYEKEMKK